MQGEKEVIVTLKVNKEGTEIANNKVEGIRKWKWIWTGTIIAETSLNGSTSINRIPCGSEKIKTILD